MAACSCAAQLVCVVGELELEVVLLRPAAGACEWPVEVPPTLSAVAAGACPACMLPLPAGAPAPASAPAARGTAPLPKPYAGSVPAPSGACWGAAGCWRLGMPKPWQCTELASVMYLQHSTSSCTSRVHRRCW